MANWNFDANDVEERSFAPIPEGNHRVRVLEVVEKMSSTNKPMLAYTLEVSGFASKVWDYLVLDNSDETARKRTNSKIATMGQSFGVQPQFVVQNPQCLVGKVGGVRIKHDTYNGEKNAKVSYYLNADKVANLPAWQNANGTVSTPDYEVIDDGVEF